MNLVEKLRYLSGPHFENGSSPLGNVLRNAADEIARLREKNEAAKRGAFETDQAWKLAQDRIAKLEADNKALKKALLDWACRRLGSQCGLCGKNVSMNQMRGHAKTCLLLY